MKLDIKKSFCSPFSEEKWYLKLIFPIIMAAFGMVSNPHLQIPKLTVLILMLISIIPSFILSGFFIQFQHNEINEELPLLPTLKSKILDYLGYGFNCFGIVLIYLSVAILLFILFGIITKLTAIFDRVLWVILVLAIILFIITLSLGQNAYADKFCFKDALDIRRISRLMSKVRVEILIYILMAVLLILLVSVMNVILSFAKLTLVFSPIFMALMQLILINLSAQVYKIAKFRLEDIQQNE